MNTIKIYLAESGRIADLHKDFPLYQGQFQDKLLNVYVPTSILAPSFEIQHYIGQISGAVAPTTDQLNEFVVANTYPSRSFLAGDVIEFYNTSTQKFFVYTCHYEEKEDYQSFTSTEDYVNLYIDVTVNDTTYKVLVTEDNKNELNIEAGTTIAYKLAWGSTEVDSFANFIG